MRLKIEIQTETALDWLVEKLVRFDLSRLSCLRIDDGAFWTRDGIWARLRQRQNGCYAVDCHVKVAAWPYVLLIHDKPLYVQPGITEDDARSALEPGQVLGQRKQCGDVAWFQRFRPMELRDLDEATVWVTGHGIFHYLRKTGQETGRNIDINADSYGLKWLAEFRETGARKTA